MRRLRSAWVPGVVLVLAVTTGPQARAQMAVIDSANLAQTTLAATRAASELRQLIAQYNQLAATYRMFTAPTDVTSLAPGLESQFVQNPLPAANLLGSLVDGRSGATGAGVAFYNRNHVYTPTDGSAASTALISAINAATLKPTQCALWLRLPKPLEQRNRFTRGFERVYGRFERAYTRLIGLMVRHSKTSVALALVVAGLGDIIGCRRPIVSVPPVLGWVTASIMGLVLRDVVLTRDEIGGLMAGLLATDAPPAGTTRLTDWARAHADSLGQRYFSELARRRNRSEEYAKL